MDNFDPALISVVMPCFNAAPYLGGAIKSVLQQNYPHVELVVVNDGSTDESVQIIERLAADNPGRITVIQQTNSGPYVARNRGLVHARGNFVAFPDADDTWRPDALNQLHAALTETLADVAYCGWQNVGEAAANTQPYIPPNYAETDAAAQYLQSCPWPINGVLLRRQLVDTLRRFSEGLPTAMDYDLWLRMLAQQPNVVRVPRVLAFIVAVRAATRTSPAGGKCSMPLQYAKTLSTTTPSKSAIEALPSVTHSYTAASWRKPIAATGGETPTPRAACSAEPSARPTGKHAMPNTFWPASCVHRY
jgi:hypothetical protein